MSFVKRCLGAVRAFRPTFSPFLRFVDQREPDRPRHLSRFVFAPFITFISQTISQLAQHNQYIHELTGVLGSVATQLAAMSTQQRLIAAPPREAVVAFLHSNRALPRIVVAPLRGADHRVQKMLTATKSPAVEIGEINVHPFAALHHAPSVEADMVRASGGQWGQSPPPTPYTARVGFSVRGLGGRAPDPSTRY
ncbi:uncharacterized protein JCM10292_000911 [Rhodotorula paludigena]|uniref:uncharacterized protein n=1 Tax=Rhodotorula paludigena TaxID=86838 RepID=UPI0031709351